MGRLAREIFEPYLNFLTSNASSTSTPLRHGKASLSSKFLPEIDIRSGTGPANKIDGKAEEAVKPASLSKKTIAGEDEGGGGNTTLHKSSSFPAAGTQDTSSGLHKQNSTMAISKHASSAITSEGNSGECRVTDSGGGSKRPSSLTISHQNHSLSNRPAKPPLLRTPPGPAPVSSQPSQPSTTSSLEVNQPVASSPVASVLSPRNQKDIPSAPPRDGNSHNNSSRNGHSGKPRELTPPPTSADHSKPRRPPLPPSFLKNHLKSKTSSSQQSSSSSLSSIPSSKDRHHQQHISSPSKPHTSSKDSLTRVSSSSSSLATSAGRQASPVVASQMSITSSSSPPTPTVTTSSSSLSGSHHKHSISPSPKHTSLVSAPSSAKEVRTHSSGKASSSSVSPPPGRPRSATPTKASRPPNGVSVSAVAALSKSLSATPSLSSSALSNLSGKDAKTGNTTSSSTDNKIKSLKIPMPNDVSIFLMKKQQYN